MTRIRGAGGGLPRGPQSSYGAARHWERHLHSRPAMRDHDSSSSLPRQALRRVAIALLAGLPTLGAGCSHGTAEAGGSGVSIDQLPAGVVLDEEGQPKGLSHYRRWSEHIGQGGGPEGREAFENLQRLGFTTLVSVDGARPDVELASEFGMTYVHVPVGYDGLDREQELQIVKATRDSDGAVYIHCHHGRHRGPAAVMVARMALEGLSADQAQADLSESGCSPNYPGLYRTVREFVDPTEAELATVGDLPSHVQAEGIQDAMTHIDHRWDFIVASMKASWAVPSRYPDIDPAHEVGMVENALRDLIEMEKRDQNRQRFLEYLEEGRAHASALEQALRKPDPAQANEAYRALKQNCTDCHVEYRN